VIHLAALPPVPRSIQDPLTTNAVNVTGTRSVVLAARDAGTRRVVFASSSSAHGIEVAAGHRLRRDRSTGQQSANEKPAIRSASVAEATSIALTRRCSQGSG